MRQDDVAEVSHVERRCFSNPWPSSAYRRELRNPLQNYYVILRAYPGQPDVTAQPPGSNGHQSGRQADGPRSLPRLPLLSFVRKTTPERSQPHIAGFAGMWLLYDEAHITTIGVDPDYRGRGLGELLLTDLIDEAVERGATWLTLEVRVSNDVAQRLYEKYGFSVHGTRRRYYSDNGEDAYIMWSRSLKDLEYRTLLQSLHAAIIERLGESLHPAIEPAETSGSRRSTREAHG
jgi:ribosomal-protein-alanine N-acetyltransferase